MVYCSSKADFIHWIYDHHIVMFLASFTRFVYVSGRDWIIDNIPTHWTSSLRFQARGYHNWRYKSSILVNELHYDVRCPALRHENSCHDISNNPVWVTRTTIGPTFRNTDHKITIHEFQQWTQVDVAMVSKITYIGFKVSCRYMNE